MTLRSLADTKLLPPLPRRSRRWLAGSLWLSLSAIALGVGSITFWLRFSQISVANSLVNARLVRVRSPIAGEFKSFYVQPGSMVKAGDVLARLALSPDQHQALLQVRAEQQVLQSQLQSAQQVLAQQQQQFAQLDRTKAQLAGTVTRLGSVDVQAQQSQIQQIQARLELAEGTYERYRQLAAAGAVARQLVDEKKAELAEARAQLATARANLLQSQTSLQASRNGAQLTPQEVNVLDQHARLLQALQVQSSLVETLRTQLQGTAQRLQQLQSRLNSQQELVLKAPVSGVVYESNREISEQVNQLEPVLSLLDCRDLWVEGVLSARQASQIDSGQPVLVQLLGQDQMLRGRVELIQSLDTGSTVKSQPGERNPTLRVQALHPPVPPELVGQPLVRVTVQIPQLAQMQTKQQFCGVGQAAHLSFARKSWGW